MAGSHTASSATAASTTGTVTNTIGSHDFTPNSRLAIRRVSPNAAQAPNHAHDRQLHALPNDQVANPAAVGSQGHADAHLLRALLDGVGHEPINADGGEHQRGSAEYGEQQHVEAFPRG